MYNNGIESLPSNFTNENLQRGFTNAFKQDIQNNYIFEIFYGKNKFLFAYKHVISTLFK